jgi:HSP20 family protein
MIESIFLQFSSDGILTIHGEHKEEHKTEDEKSGKSTRRSYTSFSRSLALPESVSEDSIQARVDEKTGQLKLTMGKKDVSATRRIAIAGGKQQSIEDKKSPKSTK